MTTWSNGSIPNTDAIFHGESKFSCDVNLKLWAVGCNRKLIIWVVRLGIVLLWMMGGGEFLPPPTYNYFSNSRNKNVHLGRYFQANGSRTKGYSLCHKRDITSKFDD